MIPFMGDSSKKKNAYEYNANTQRLASSRVPFRAARTVFDPIRACSAEVPNPVEASEGPKCKVLAADAAEMAAI